MVEMAVVTSERFYGFGLQTNAFEQRGLRREIRISSWTAGNIGLGLASMPFFISSKGYGVLVNSSRYTTFYVASKKKLDESIASGTAEEGTEKIALSSLAL